MGVAKAKEPLTRVTTQESPMLKVLRLGIGVLWIIAGLLQFQPLMFTPDFYAWYPPNIMESVIQGITDGQPQFVVSLVHFGSTVWSTEPVLFNVLAASLQLVIGFLFVYGKGRAAKVGFIISIGWGLVVWVFAEAFGQIFGGAGYFDGAPGAALLYVIVAILLLLDRSSKGLRLHGQMALRYLTTMYWFYMALLQILPSSGYWQPRGLMEPIATAGALPQPRFLSNPIEHFGTVIMHYGPLINLVLVVLMVVMAGITLFNAWNRVTIVLALVWLFWSWWFGQDFGGLFAGAATDLNSIPAIAVWTLALVFAKQNRATPGRNQAS